VNPFLRFLSRLLCFLPDCILLNQTGASETPWELAMAQNGRIWSGARIMADRLSALSTIVSC